MRELEGLGAGEMRERERWGGRGMGWVGRTSSESMIKNPFF